MKGGVPNKDNENTWWKKDVKRDMSSDLRWIRSGRGNNRRRSLSGRNGCGDRGILNWLKGRCRCRRCHRWSRCCYCWGGRRCWCPRCRGCRCRGCRWRCRRRDCHCSTCWGNNRCCSSCWWDDWCYRSSSSTTCYRLRRRFRRRVCSTCWRNCDLGGDKRSEQ